MTDVLPTGEEPEDELDPDALAAELDLGIDLSPEEQAAAEEMVAHLQAQFADQDDEPEPEVEEEEEPEEEPEEVPTPAPEVVATSAAPSTRGAVVIDGVEVPVEEAVAYLTRREVQREAAQSKPAPPEPPKPPEWLDQDDPAQMAMWARQQQLELQVQKLAAQQEQVALNQAKSQVLSEFEAGLSIFRQDHLELNEQDIGKLRTHAASMEIIDAMAKSMGGVKATTKALEIAYKDLPEFWTRETGQPTAAEAKKAERAEKKQKLNALGGSSGSVPRTETRPTITNDREMKAAAKAWLVEQGIVPN